MASKHNLFIALIAAVAGLVAPGLAQSVAIPEAGPPLLHSLWERSPSQYIRQWEFSGPLENSDEGALPKTWIEQRAWGDTVDVGDALSIPATQLNGAHRLTAYARVSISRETDGPTNLLVGVDGEYEVFVGGARVFRSTRGTTFSPDRDVIPVTLNKGVNEIALRLVSHGGPWRLALRAADTDALALRSPELALDLSEKQDTVVISSTDKKIPGASPKFVAEAIGVGGVVIARGEAKLDQAITFSKANWPDGPYEIRCSSSDGWGKEHSTYLPWYKGDSLLAARRLLLESERAPAGPEGDHLRMLADLVRDRLGGHLDQAGPLAWQQIHSALLEFLELKDGQTGKSLALHPSGFVRLAYTDPVDGSTQFCRAYLPRHYNAAQPSPLVVVLHGFNPPNPSYIHWWSVDLRHSESAENQDVIVLEPMGRGNTQYLGLGENDVLHALGEARRIFNVDADRVYLLGESMGGHGTWSIGSRNPDIFAAIAPYFGGWDFRMVPPQARGFAGVVPANKFEKFVFDSSSSFAHAENLLHVPIYVSHGDADRSVSVEFSRHIVQQLNRWGYDVRFEEHPGMMHEELRTREKVIAWLLSHRRDPAPHKIRLHSFDLAAARGYWLSVDARESAFEEIDVVAELIAPDTVRIDTRNAAALSLRLPKQLTTSDSLNVIWNGAAQSIQLKNGEGQLTSPNLSASPLKKSAGFEGAISSIISKPFIVVIGTSSPDPRMRELCRIKAAAFVEGWQRWQHVRPRVRNDDELTEDEKKNFSLILIGGADANRVSQELRDQLPVSVAPDAVTISGRSFPVSDAVVSLIYPNPRAKTQYVLLVAGTSAAGLYYWNPILWAEPFGFGNIACDWYIKDGRAFTVSLGHNSATSYLAYGTFDQAWRRDDATTYYGDSSRNQSPRRQPPAGLSTAQTGGGVMATLPLANEFTGSYELPYAGTFTLSNREGAILLQAPGGISAHLLKESEDSFGAVENGALVHFSKDGSTGKAVMTIQNDGGEIRLNHAGIP